MAGVLVPLALFFLGLMIGALMAGVVGWVLHRNILLSATSAIPDVKALNLNMAILQKEHDRAKQNWSIWCTTAKRLEAQLQEKDKKLSESQQRNLTLTAEKSSLATRLQNVQERWDNSQKALENAFTALSQKALDANNHRFWQLAQAKMQEFRTGAIGDLDQRKQAVEALVAPIRETLKDVNIQITTLEQVRHHDQGVLSEQIRSLTSRADTLSTKTNELVSALRAPHVRGSWGEIQLKRVVELAGMIEYCDFDKQVTVRAEGELLKPDMVVRLPSDKNIIIDAKTPLKAFLEALEARDEPSRKQKLKEHAEQVRARIQELGSKKYSEQFQPSPEFVVMFLPGESFFAAALEQAPSLIEDAINEKVILATPTTLIALLKAVYYGWRQEKIAKNAQDIADLGKLLYDRVHRLVELMEKTRKGLNNTVSAYNEFVGSLETRFLVTARNLAAHCASSGEELPLLAQIETTARESTICEEQEEEVSRRSPPPKG